jgi:membrane protein
MPTILARRREVRHVTEQTSDAQPGVVPTAGHLRRPATTAGRVTWRASLATVRTRVKQDRITVAAGSFAYRWFLSLFPVVIALLGAASLVRIPDRVMARLVDGVSRALPAGAASVLTEAVRNSAGHARGAVTTIVVAGVVALWSATSGMVIIEEGLDMAYQLPQDRSFLAKRLRALPLLAASVLLGGGASALVVFGPAIGSTLRSAGPLTGTALVVAWTALRWVAALILVGILLSVLYCWAPNRPHPHWQWLSPGALLATCLWAATSVGLSFYTSISGSYSKTYGAFAGVAILIFWLYLTGMIVLVGGEVNAAFERADSSPPTSP